MTAVLPTSLEIRFKFLSMINIFIGILTVAMVLDCLLLILLVLVQLPKKEAGAGLAFGGAATDALFGAGSGNALTKITKYVATAFFVLAIFLSLLYLRRHRGSTSALEEELGKASVPVTPAMPVFSSNALRTTSALVTNLAGTNRLSAPTNQTPPPAVPK